MPTPDEFLVAVRKQIEDRGIVGEALIPLARGGCLAGQPKRGIVRVKDRRIVGYSLVVRGLSDADSIALQERGLGGKRRMGAGWFVALRAGA
jgi:CRISPR-associated endonuclease/helicase Cas3